MDDYKPNSHLSKSTLSNPDPIPVSDKKVEKVVNGNVKVKKKTGLQKMAESIVQEDVQNVKNYIFLEVLMPALKKAISDVVTNGIDMLLYGEAGRTKKKSVPGSRVSYRSYYDDSREGYRYSRPARASGYDYEEIIFDNRGDAEEVLSSMDEALDRYGTVSIADFYDLAGIPSKHTDYKYGWTDLRGASVLRVRDGYIIKFSRALPID